MIFQKGKTYRIYVPSLGEIRKVHVVELIENDMIVYKWFGKHKQWWHYFVLSNDEFAHYLELAKKLAKPSHTPPVQ